MKTSQLSNHCSPEPVVQSASVHSAHSPATNGIDLSIPVSNGNSNHDRNRPQNGVLKLFTEGSVTSSQGRVNEVDSNSGGEHLDSEEEDLNQDENSGELVIKEEDNEEEDGLGMSCEFLCNKVESQFT